MSAGDDDNAPRVVYQVPQPRARTPKRAATTRAESCLKIGKEGEGRQDAAERDNCNEDRPSFRSMLAGTMQPGQSGSREMFESAGA